MKIQIMLFLIPFVCISSKCNGQILSEGDTSEIGRIENAVTKNILLYRILSSNYYDSYYNEGVFRSKYTNSALNILPDPGFKLRLEVSKSKLLFVDTTYKLYEVHKKGEVYFNELGDTEKRVCIDCNSRKDGYYLIGTKSESGYNNIIFLSGDFFVNDFMPFYIKNPDNIMEYDLRSYLQIRLFEYIIKSLVFKRETRRYFFYEGYSEILKSKIAIRFDKKELMCRLITADRSPSLESGKK